MMYESLLLQFCYTCDLGSEDDTFDILKNRIKWNFQAYLEDLSKQKVLFQDQEENDGFLWPNLGSTDENDTWQPTYYLVS